MLDRQYLATDETRHIGPANDGERGEQHHQPAHEMSKPAITQNGRQDDEEEEGAKRVDGVDHPHQQIVDPAACPAGGQANQSADHGDDCGRHQSNRQADPRAVDEPTQHIARQHVSAEQVARVVPRRPEGRREGQSRRGRGVRVVGRQERREQRDQPQCHDEDDTGNGGFVPA